MNALTLREVAAELRVSYSQAKRLVLVHGLPYLRVGERRIIVRRADLEAWVESRLVKQGT